MEKRSRHIRERLPVYAAEKMKVVKLLFIPFVLLFVLIMRGLRNKVVIRFGELWSFRLGHLVGNTECYLSEKDMGYHKGYIDIWFDKGKIANKVISKKYNKLLHVWPRSVCILIILVNKLFKRASVHEISPYQYDRDVYNLWKGPHIGFTEKEEKEGKKLLDKLKIPHDGKWVCLIVRDSAYLKEKFPGANYSYHDYRDADIEDYRLAAQALHKLGYYVIRMGEVVSRPIDSPFIIDYTKQRTELGDLYLGAKCSFCLGTSCGFMSIPQVFKRPCVVTNFVPVEYISTFCEDLVIWKHHIKDGKTMTFKEIIDSGAGQFMSGHEFTQAGITLENNSPKEILDVTLEMVKGVKSDQKDFWDKFPKSSSPYNNKRLHGEMKARIGRKFLARVQNHSKAGHQGSEPCQASTV